MIQPPLFILGGAPGKAIDSGRLRLLLTINFTRFYCVFFGGGCNAPGKLIGWLQVFMICIRFTVQIFRAKILVTSIFEAHLYININALNIIV